jgi:uncharacterized protein
MMELGQVNHELKQYTEQEILPQYEKNDAGHRLDHILIVLGRSFELANKNELELDPDMVYSGATWHDIGVHIDRKTHEKISAELFMADPEMPKFFDDSQREIIKEAIEDHRASSDREPRSWYGKLLSSADRSTDIDTVFRRVHSFSVVNFPDLSIDEWIDRGYEHIEKKFGKGGYAKNYLADEEYENYLKQVDEALSDREKFREIYLRINGLDGGKNE